MEPEDEEDSVDDFLDEGMIKVEKARKLMFQELRGPAIIKVFTAEYASPEGQVVIPETYYLAAGEMMSLVIVISWILTLIAQPVSMVDPTKTVFEDNALKRRLGYNTLCVGFDCPPATYVASVLWIFVAFLAMKFAMLDMQRTQLVRDRLTSFKACFSVATDALYMLSFAGFTLVFVIHPWDDVWGHSGGFILLQFVQWLVFLANIMEGENVLTISWIFVVFYGIVTVGNCAIISSNYLYYTKHGYGPWNPWWLGALFDYGWVGCLPLTTIFLPNAEALYETARVISPDKIGQAEEDYDDGDF